jgi:GDP-D-mannose dehydratase
VDVLQGNPIKAKTILGWSSTISFDELVKDMVNYDIQLYAKGDYTS